MTDKHIWKRRRVVGTILIIAVCCCPQKANARAFYYRLWLEKYPAVAKKQNVQRDVKCCLCHARPEKGPKTSYGTALNEALAGIQKQTRLSDKEIIERILRDVEHKKSAIPGRTFGDLLRAGNLPLKADELPPNR